MPTKVIAAEFALLGAAAEEGDDRLRPAAGFHGSLDSTYFVRAWVYGRSFGPVTEKTILGGASRRLPAFGIKELSVGVGFCAMVEKTDIEYSDAPADNDSESRYNLGAILGLHYLIEPIPGIFATAGWESYIFAAGPGVIFLSTARKQMVSIGAGVKFK